MLFLCPPSKPDLLGSLQKLPAFWPQCPSIHQTPFRCVLKELHAAESDGQLRVEGRKERAPTAGITSQALGSKGSMNETSQLEERNPDLRKQEGKDIKSLGAGR